ILPPRRQENRCSRLLGNPASTRGFQTHRLSLLFALTMNNPTEFIDHLKQYLDEEGLQTTLNLIANLCFGKAHALEGDPATTGQAKAWVTAAWAVHRTSTRRSVQAVSPPEEQRVYAGRQLV